MRDDTNQGPEEVRQASAAPQEAMRTPPTDIHRWIEEEGVIEGYLQSRLDPESLAVFEEHYLGCDDCVRQLEVAERFEDGLRGVASEEAMAGAAVVRLGVLAAISRWMAQRPMMMAAPWLLLLVFATLGWQQAGERARLTSELAQLQQPRAVSPPMLLDVVRSTEGATIPTLVVDRGAAPRSLILAVVTEGLGLADASVEPQSGVVEAILRSEGGETLWHGTDLLPSAGLLHLAIPDELLPVGTYHLEVAPQGNASHGVGQGGALRLDLTFRVAAPPD